MTIHALEWQEDCWRYYMDTLFHSEVTITLDDQVVLGGELVLPQQANGIVIFSHGSGSSRFSPRNKKVAMQLHRSMIGTFLFDLLTPEEDRDHATRFNIELLTRRLVSVTNWLSAFEPARNYNMGYFGASTGAASALKAAARLPKIKAVISRGGRPDLAMDVLPMVKAPVLLIVGSLDPTVFQLNEQAYAHLRSEKKLEIVQGASHLFSEEGTLEKAAALAVDWCLKYLRSEV